MGLNSTDVVLGGSAPNTTPSLGGIFALKTGLQSPDFRVRLDAVESANYFRKGYEDLFVKAANDDPDFRVRLSAFQKLIAHNTLQERPSPPRCNYQGILTQRLQRPPEGLRTYHPDIDRLCIGTAFGSLSFYSFQDGPSLPFQAHSGTIAALAFSEDGSYLASAGADSLVKVWDVGGNFLYSTCECSEPPRSLAVSPNGRYIAAANGNTVTLRHLDGSSPISLPKHDWGAACLAFSPDSKTLVTGANDGYVKLWSLHGQRLQTLTKHEWGVESVVFSPEGDYIVSGGKDRLVKISTALGEVLRGFEAHDAAVRCVAISPDSAAIASCSIDNHFKIWTIDGKLLHSFQDHQWGVYYCSFTPDGKNFFSIGGDNSITFYQ